MKVRFTCPGCGQWVRHHLSDAAETAAWRCSCCSQKLLLHLSVPTGHSLHVCPRCGNPELYKRKNFPHWLGLTILTLACLGFLYFMAHFQWYWAWAVLLGSAVIDGLLYLSVGDAIVCYRCETHVTGVSPGPDHQPFELSIHERYRQERIRREQIGRNESTSDRSNEAG